MGKTRIKKGGKLYDPVESMRLTALSNQLEVIARELYEKACCGSKPIWAELNDEIKFEKDKAGLLSRFMSLAHRGMREAQNEIVDRLIREPVLSPSEEVLFRGIADAIAWQFLGSQLCHARRLYKEHAPPRLRHCNLSSVVRVAKRIVDEDPDAMPLISDLTSFVQVGDILLMSPREGRAFIEVKEGVENRRIADFLHFYLKSGCDKALQIFSETSSQSSIKQFGRMLRQAERMAHVCQILRKGEGADPDTGQVVSIPEEFIQVDPWDDELNELLDASATKDWNIQVIDECLFLGCYSANLRACGHVAFNCWFDSCGGAPKYPRARLIDSMTIPLALPIFNRRIAPNKMFDILFGRVQVCMGINVEALLDRCRQEGLRVRFATNKEASQLDQKGGQTFRHNGKAIFIGNADSEFAIADGIFLRMLFHSQKPISLINALLSNAKRA